MFRDVPKPVVAAPSLHILFLIVSKTGTQKGNKGTRFGIPLQILCLFLEESAF